jgi:hypothetical protein
MQVILMVCVMQVMVLPYTSQALWKAHSCLMALFLVRIQAHCLHTTYIKMKRCGCKKLSQHNQLWVLRAIMALLLFKTMQQVGQWRSMQKMAPVQNSLIRIIARVITTHVKWLP